MVDVGVKFLFYLVEYVSIWLAVTSRYSLIGTDNSGTEIVFRNPPSAPYTDSLIEVTQRAGPGVTSQSDALVPGAGICEKQARNKV